MCIRRAGQPGMHCTCGTERHADNFSGALGKCMVISPLIHKTTSRHRHLNQKIFFQSSEGKVFSEKKIPQQL